MSDIRTNAVSATNLWDGDPEGVSSNWNGWLDVHSENFDGPVADLRADLNEAFDALTLDPSNPAKLARYQTALSEYNLYRMLQSNSSKNLADMQKQNARTLS